MFSKQIYLKSDGTNKSVAFYIFMKYFILKLKGIVYIYFIPDRWISRTCNKITVMI